MIKRQYYYFCLLYFLYYISFGAISPYINVYLEGLGLNGSQIGTISSLGLVAGMAGAPLFGMIADKLKNARLSMAIVFVCCSLSLFVFSLQRVYGGLLLWYVIFGFFRNTMSPLSDGLASSFCDDTGLEFSPIRTSGSFGYMFGSFILSALLAWTGKEAPYIGFVVVCFLVCCFLSFAVPEGHNEVEKFSLKRDLGVLLKSRAYIFVVFYYCTSVALTDAINSFVGNHFVFTMGLSQDRIGIYTVAMIIPELFLMYFGNRLLEVRGYKAFYIFAGVCQLMRCVVYSLTSSYILFLLFTALHGIPVVAVCVGNTRFLSKTMDRHLLSTAMAVHSSLGSLACALYSKLFGVLYDSFGSYSMFYLAAGVSLAMLVAAVRTSAFNGFDE